PSDKIRTAFGQSSTITPIQQLKAATAIANEGEMVQPYVIQKIVDSNTNDVLEENKTKSVGKPISKETAAHMIELMDSVVNSDDGTGRKIKLDNYSLIGKTGTAQVPNPDGKGYLTGKENYVFSFIGMALKDESKMLMQVSVTQPKKKDEEVGLDPVSCILKNVMENGLHYLNIEPDKDKSISDVESFVFPEVID